MLGTRRLPGRPLILAGVAVTALLAGAGVAMAATSGSPASGTAAASPAGGTVATPSPSARPAYPHQGRPGGFGIGFGGPFGAVHGQFVVPKSGGGYQTIAFQNGKVPAVSSTSITLHSADGYSRSYQVTSSTLVNAQRDGIGSIKSGNQVIATATVSGSTATATRIIDVSMIQQGLHSFFGRAHAPNFQIVTP